MHIFPEALLISNSPWHVSPQVFVSCIIKCYISVKILIYLQNYVLFSFL